MPRKKKSLQYEHLKQKWLKYHKDIQKEIFDNHKDAFDWLVNNSKQLAVGSLAGVFMLSTPVVPQIPTDFSSDSATLSRTVDKKIFLIYDLKNVLPQEVRPLNSIEEQQVGEVLARTYGFQVTPELEGKRLNTSYGYIGQEQHLARYPGDTMLTHFQSSEDTEKYWKYGMAPGLGAWGHFAYSRDALTQKDIDREKYYLAVQTFLAPGFKENVREYVNFFKYRKMIVVNPQNGKAMVVVIGDAGPAPWTGKHLGGSPEVMKYLERVDGRQKGPVLYFFIDDPDDKIPLGPIEL